MTRIPENDKAIVPASKLTGYVLNRAHPVGRNKARVFESILGITAAKAGLLEDQIREGVKHASFESSRESDYGTTYTVPIPITGPKGTAIVTTAWIVREAGGAPQLVTAYIDTKRQKE
ncbi:hypothetical protein D5125_16945 [Magnetovirga frankeli]|uniref:DUF6883 domain-containing protein n=1 Tax=Magnetovirga frankeli TaxID=947516 RepID=UPI001293F758|nr:hypothetical protein D5125_16945 [gamma proteobacterium SS-5]